MIETRDAVPSAYNTINANRSVGYDMGTALADIIDNSISAGATCVSIFTSVNPFRISIYDNGSGMNQQELDNAMTFGGNELEKQRGPRDLGRFGLGLKTASLSQCKKLTVVTKQDGVLIGGCWDIDYLKLHNTWAYQVVPLDECKKLCNETLLAHEDSGTLVLWDEFDTLQKTSTNTANAFTERIAKAKAHLELVFHRYLQGSTDPFIPKLTITINESVLKPNDPFLSNKMPEISPQYEISFRNQIIKIQPHKLLYPGKISDAEKKRLALGQSLLETQGFYVYRNYRLIIWGTWFRLAPKLDSSKLARIQVDIPNSLDEYWFIDIKKSTVTPPEEIRKQFRQIIYKTVELSKNTFTRRKASNRSDLITYWQRLTDPEGVITYQINRNHPLLQHFSQSLTEQQQGSFSEIISAIETFIPIPNIQNDLQSDKTIMNETTSEILGEKNVFTIINKLVELGIPFDEIIKMEPVASYKEFIDAYKKEVLHGKG